MKFTTTAVRRRIGGAARALLLACLSVCALGIAPSHADDDRRDVQRGPDLHARPASDPHDPGARELDLDGKPIAVEKNRDVVPKSKYPETLLKDGDVLEIVHLVGGG